MNGFHDIDYVSGYWMDPDYEADHVAAWEQVKHIEGAVLTDEVVSMMSTFTLDPALTTDLNPLQKLVLANGGPAPYGGQVQDGYVVTVFTPGGDAIA